MIKIDLIRLLANKRDVRCLPCLFFGTLLLTSGLPVLAESQPQPVTGPFKIKPHEVPDTCNRGVAQIRVTVNNIGAGGVLNVGLYDDPEHFLFKKGRKRTVRVPAKEGQQTVCMNLDQPGTYAVAAYHDQNADRKLKLRWNMMPDEPSGLSNNPARVASFPKFSDSAFSVDSKGADIVINLRQP